MPIVLCSLAFVAAALCAGVMGYTIQRGASCTVPAVDEVVAQRTARRLLSLLEAALLAPAVWSSPGRSTCGRRCRRATRSAAGR